MGALIHYYCSPPCGPFQSCLCMFEAKSLRPRRLACGALGRGAQLTFLHSLVESRIFHNVHLWPHMFRRQFESFIRPRRYCRRCATGTLNARSVAYDRVDDASVVLKSINIHQTLFSELTYLCSFLVLLPLVPPPHILVGIIQHSLLGGCKWIKTLRDDMFGHFRIPTPLLAAPS